MQNMSLIQYKMFSKALCIVASRVNNTYIEESILLPYTPVQLCSVKLWHNDNGDVYEAPKIPVATTR